MNDRPRPAVSLPPAGPGTGARHGTRISYLAGRASGALAPGLRRPLSSAQDLGDLRTSTYLPARSAPAPEALRAPAPHACAGG